MNFEIQKFCKGYCKFCKHINPLTLGGNKKVTILKCLIHHSKSKVKRNFPDTEAATGGVL